MWCSTSYGNNSCTAIICRACNFLSKCNIRQTVWVDYPGALECFLVERCTDWKNTISLPPYSQESMLFSIAMDGASTAKPVLINILNSLNDEQELRLVDRVSIGESLFSKNNKQKLYPGHFVTEMCMLRVNRHDQMRSPTSIMTRA